MKKALGLIETMGLTASITAADAAVKSANVVLLGRENTRGAGLTSIKFEGDVGAVKAAVDAGAQAASAVGQVVSAHVIPRPDDGIDNICIYNDRMIGGTSVVKQTTKVENKETEKVAEKVEPEKVIELSTVKAEKKDVKKAVEKKDIKKVTEKPTKNEKSAKSKKQVKKNSIKKVNSKSSKK